MDTTINPPPLLSETMERNGVAARPTDSPPPPPKRPGSLTRRVVFAVIAGMAVGLAFGSRPILAGLGVDHLGQLGLLVIRLLKTLAVPLVLFAILDSMTRNRIAPGHAGRLLRICLVNVAVAMVIGLTLMNSLEPGRRWMAWFHPASATPADNTASSADSQGLLQKSRAASLSPLQNLAGYIPKSLVEPFAENNLITIVLGSLLAGAALRRLKDHPDATPPAGIQALEGAINAIYQMLVQVLQWVVQLVPFAVFGVVAQSVGRSGLAAFVSLWAFVAVIGLGLGLHALVYYPLLVWWRSGRAPLTFLRHGSEAILTGLSTNSSLATVPVTLRCLTERMGVSDTAARLSACIGTNLNNDGITLYEAMAALFITQACGLQLALDQQLSIVLASVMAGIGIAGIPEAGLIVLPLVLGAAGLPETAVVTALPLLLSVDWLVARCRSAVNVMGDMVVALLLDQGMAPSLHPVEAAVTRSHGQP